MKDIKVNPHPNKTKYIYMYVWKSIFILLCKLGSQDQSVCPEPAGLPLDWCSSIGPALQGQTNCSVSYHAMTLRCIISGRGGGAVILNLIPVILAKHSWS